MRKRKIIFSAAFVVGVVGWYAFRPERLFINTTVNEPFGAGASAMQAGSPAVALPTALATGEFHTVHHDTQGKAAVYRMADGKRVLRLTDFVTSNGPDVRIYLVAAPDANDDATVKRSEVVELGPMKGNQGNQNYDIPDSVDLAKYRAVTVWCKRFAVNFATAPLSAS